MFKENYSYDLPRELVAHLPAEPRDSARLLIYDTVNDRVIFDMYRNISQYIPENSLIVLNNTKVVPARLNMIKENGKSVEILFLINEWDKSKLIKGLPNKGISIGERLMIGNVPLIRAVAHINSEFEFEILTDTDQFMQVIQEQGKTPIPPYIEPNLGEVFLRNRYQTEFAKKPASVAAPTASLHITPEVLRSFANKNIATAEVTLHVGRGTFATVSDESHKNNSLHLEPIYIDKESAEIIFRSKKANNVIVASGTTALRTLESAAGNILRAEPYSGTTGLFIKPPYEFRVTDALITNFHLPKTSLIMLLDAFLQHKKAKRTWRDIYDIAIGEKFRFYSFGDAMLII